MFELVICSCGFPQCSGGVALGLVTICHSEGDFTGSLSLLKNRYGLTTNYSTRVRAPTRLVKDQYSNDSVVLNPHSGRAADDVFMNPRKPTENIKKQKKW